MNNISFDDGYKSFSINNDPSKVISFNPSDYNLLERFVEAKKNIVKEVEKVQQKINLSQDGQAEDDLELSANLIGEVNVLIKDLINGVFNSNVYDIAFGNQSPISTVKGKFLFERFMDAVTPVIEAEIKAEQAATQKRVSKYTSMVK